MSTTPTEAGRGRAAWAVLWALAGIACTPVATAGPGCASTGGTILLPRVLDETSGAAISRRHPGTVWTHNDGGSRLYAVDGGGRVVSEHRLPDRLRDWEDIAIADCPEGGSCLYLADTGDNLERRGSGSIRILRVREPVTLSPPSGEPRLLDAEAFPLRLPDGPRDIEALFVLPGERPYLITKGRAHAITVYRYPPPLRPDTVLLEEVQRLSGAAMALLAQVTGASASPDGTVVAVRTYQALEFFDVAADTLARRSDGVVNLRALEEIQGEAVSIGGEGLVVLTSEGGPLGGPGSMRLLRCSLGTA